MTTEEFMRQVLDDGRKRAYRPDAWVIDAVEALLSDAINRRDEESRRKPPTVEAGKEIDR